MNKIKTLWTLKGKLLGRLTFSLLTMGTALSQAAETVQYGYDAQGRLATVANADGTTKQFLYEDASFPNALSGTIDELGVRYSTWQYDSHGRATSTFEAGNINRVDLVYNADGSVTVTDALGAVRTFTFSRVGDRNVTSGISGSQCPTCNESKSATYNDYGWVTSRTDYNNNVTQYSYDNSRGLETSRTEAYGTSQARTITTQWHATYRLPTEMDGPGLRATFTYDVNGNMLTRTLTDTVMSVSRTWTYTYNAFGQVLTVDGPRSDAPDVTTLTYYMCTTGYECGHVSTVTNALGQTSTFNSYNAAGQPLTMTDANGVVTTLAYDVRQRLISRSVGGETTLFEYWSTGLMKKVTQPDGSFSKYTYDSAHRLTQIEDGEGNRIAYTLDAMGNRTKEEIFDASNALTNTRSQVFNSLSRLYQVIAAANTSAVTTTLGYDANGNPTTVNAPMGRNATNQYDELNRLQSNTDPMSGVTQYGYNALDQLITVTDPRNLQTTYGYNALGDLLSKASPDTGITINTFDSAGNLNTTTDARNKTATYSYDALNRVTQIAYPNQTHTYSYDAGANAVGRLSSVADTSGSTNWTYTPQGRIGSKTQNISGIAKTVTYEYNSAGQLSSILTPSGKTITYTYANDRISGVQVNGIPMATSVLYEPFGPASGWTWGNGSLSVRVFDTDGKVTHIDSAGLNTYQYDDAFRITGITDTSNSANTLAYGYDSLDRVISGNTTGQSQTFTYDADSNRLSQGGTSSSTFTPATSSNHLTTVTGALSKNYVYDDAGNMTSDGTTTYTYNDTGRMTSAIKAGVSTTYLYNALGQRVRKSNATETTYFVYDEAGHILGEYDQAGTLIEEIVWLNDTPIATIRWGSCGMAIFYIHTDHLNTPRKITKRSTPDIVWRWDSDAFGATQANENPSGLGAFAFNLRFPGQYFDSETGTHYNYLRNYDPVAGRYLTSDPIGLYGGLNVYAYVGGNPISRFDQYGLMWLPGDPINQSFVNAVTGFGDGVSNFLTFGFYSTSDVRESWGIDGGIDKCSASYNGGKFAGNAWGAATMWAAGLNGGANSAFWAGGANATRAAQMGESLASTPVGKVLNSLGEVVPDWMWKAASATFAANARGTALKVGAEAGKIWTSIESRILNWRNIPVNVVP